MLTCPVLGRVQLLRGALRNLPLAARISARSFAYTLTLPFLFGIWVYHVIFAVEVAAMRLLSVCERNPDFRPPSTPLDTAGVTTR
jgi:hypothetical protein